MAIVFIYNSTPIFVLVLLELFLSIDKGFNKRFVETLKNWLFMHIITIGKNFSAQKCMIQLVIMTFNTEVELQIPSLK